jgi:hypothetical protein
LVNPSDRPSITRKKRAELLWYQKILAALTSVFHTPQPSGMPTKAQNTAACGARPWEIVYFFPELNQSVDAVFGRWPYVRCALTTKNTGGNMVEWCGNGIVSLVSSGNNGGVDAELACARPLVGAHP